MTINTLKCPKCQSEMKVMEKDGKTFLRCYQYPECDEERKVFTMTNRHYKHMASCLCCKHLDVILEWEDNVWEGGNGKLECRKDHWRMNNGGFQTPNPDIIYSDEEKAMITSFGGHPWTSLKDDHQMNSNIHKLMEYAPTCQDFEAIEESDILTKKESDL